MSKRSNEPVVVLMFLLALLFLTDTTAFCADRLVVAIDAGHSWAVQGAVSSRGVGEFVFNRNLARMLREELQKDPRLKPVLFNEEGKDIPLRERARMINKIKPGLLLSIHHDAVQPVYISKWFYEGKTRDYCDLFRGYSIFYSEKNAAAGESRRLALALGKELSASGLAPSLHHAEKIRGEGREIIDRGKGVFRFDGLVILKEARCPAILLECGVIKNREEELLLTGTAHQSRIIAAIRKAVSEYPANK